MVQDIVDNFNDVPENDSASNRKALEQSLHLPESFYVGQAAGQGDCFFDAVAQGLCQIRPKKKFTVKLLRMVCKRFAERSLSDEHAHWFRESLAYEEKSNKELPLDRYIESIELTAAECATHNGSIWGRPEIEGRILCEEYGIKLHVAERHQDVWTNDRISVTGSMAAPPQYEAENTVHIVNSNGFHFEPILRKNFFPTSKLQHLNHECELENIQVDGMLHKFGALFAGNPQNGPAIILQDLNRDKILRKDSGSVIVDSRDINDELLIVPRNCSDTVDEVDQNSLVTFRDAVISSNVDLVQRLLRQWRSWPFDVADNSFQPENSGNSLVHELWAFLKINKDSVSEEMRNLLEEEILLRKYLLDIVQTMTYIRDIEHKSREGNSYQSGNHDVLIIEILRITCTALTSWIDYQERLIEKGKEYHHHKLNLLLFSFVTRNIESLLEDNGKLGLPRKLFQEVEDSLGGILITLINHERLKYIVNSVARVKTELLQHSCNKSAIENVEKCDSLLRDIQNCSCSSQLGKLDIDSVKSLRKHLEELREKLPAAKLRVEELDNITDTSSSEGSLAIIKDALILDDLTRILQTVPKEDAHWFHRFLLKRILLHEQSTLKSLQCLTTNASGDFQDIWKKIQEKVQYASERVNGESMKIAFDESFSGQENLTNGTQPDNRREEIDYDVDDGQLRNITRRTTFQGIHAEYIQLVNNCTDNYSMTYQELINRADCNCATELCIKFVTATARSESKMVVSTSSKQKFETEFPSSEYETIAQTQDTIQIRVDRLIKSTLDEFLNKNLRGKVSEESRLKFRTSISKNYQINQMKSALRTFFNNYQMCSSSNAKSISDNQDDYSREFVRESLDVTNTAIEDPELPIHLEKMAARKIAGDMKTHLTTILLESFSRIKFVINKCSTFMELLQFCKHNLQLRSSLEMLVWESLKILKAASSPVIYAQLENILRSSMSVMGRIPYCPFISISLFDYLSPGSLLGAFIGDRLITTVLIGYLLATEGEILIAIKDVLEINGGCEFLVNSLSASFDPNGIKKPISKFDELVATVKASRYWKNNLWKRNLIILLKNLQIMESDRAKDQQYVWQLFEMEIFDECNFKNVDLWRTRTNVAAIKSPHGNSLLHKACKIGDGCLVEDLLKNGADANSFNDDHNTPMHIASYHNNLDVIKTLIGNSAKLNVVNDHYFTALHIAVSCGHLQNVQILLDNGADIEATTENGFTPLFFALPHVEVVKLLMDSKANVNARNLENSTPLHEASRFGHKESVKLLLKNGAKLNAMDNSYGTPLHVAVVHGQTDIVRTLLHDGADIYDVCRSKCTLLHHAAFNGNAKILELMLEKGLQVDKLDEIGMTPLHLATIGGHLSIIDILRHYFPMPAFIDTADVKGRTALHYAAMQEDCRLVDTLVKFGASVHTVDAEGNTPLHVSAMRSNIKVAMFLLNSGANTETLNHNMCTSLTVAARFGYEGFCESIREIPNDGNSIEELRTNQLAAEQSKPFPESNKSPSSIVFSSASLSPEEDNRYINDTQIVDKKHVIDHKNDMTATMHNETLQTTDQNIISPKTNQNFGLIQRTKEEQNIEKNDTDQRGQWAPIHTAVVNNDTGIVSTLLINKGGVDSLGEDNITPLQLAAEMGYAHCVDILLKNGADVNAVSGYHRRAALHFASRNGHNAIIEKLIAAKTDINGRDELGNTPIHLAVERGEIESAQLLLDNGALVNSYNDTRSTPLHIAAIHGLGKLLEKLLKLNADINSTDARGCTPLSLAVRQGHDSATAILLSHGAETGIRDNDGWAPLHIATQNDNVGIMKALLDFRADENICGKDNFCPLHLAVISGSLRSIRLLLLRGADVNKRNRTNHAPLHITGQTGDCAVVKLLLDGGANTEVSDVNGFTPLLEAIRHGHINVVQELVNAGAKVDHYCKEYDIRPIHAAIASRRLDILQLLIERGAKVNVHNKNHITPLWLAAFYRFPEVIGLLLKSKASINAADQQNNTALHIAARGGNSDVVKALLINGANADALNNKNWTPLHEAIERRHRNVVEILLASGASFEIPMEKNLSALHLAAGRGDLQIVALLDAADADINAKDRNNSQTPLHHAVQNGHVDIAQFLILNGANVNAADSGRLTPLRLAVGIQNLPLVNLLLDNGADVNVQDDSQDTPLQVAVKNGASAELIQILLDSGTDVNSSSQEQHFTALHLAIAQNNVDIAEVLLRNGAEVNARTSVGATPLHMAAGLGHLPLAKMLIESFADVNNLTTESLTPLHEAAGEGHLEVVNILLDHGAEVNAAGNDERCRPLHCAAAEGHHGVIESLLNRGAEVDAVLKSGKTALYLSVNGGRVQAVKTLLQHGANALVRTANRSTMLHAAAFSNDVEIIQLILRAMTIGQSHLKLHLEATNDRGDTALIFAAWSNKKISVDTLWKLGASSNARNCRKFTGLHYAARSGDRDVVDILCRKRKVDSIRSELTGMDVAMEMNTMIDLPNISGDSALHLAVQSNHVEVVETLLQRGANVHLLNDCHFTPLQLAAEKGFWKILEVLRLYGADVNASNNADFFTPLHLAAMEGHAKAVRFLVQNGALLDRPLNHYDITPLYLAAQNGHAKAAKILLDNGANPIAVKHSSTVLHAAISSGKLEIVDLVISKINSEYSVEPFLNAVDYAGDTPLMWAAQAGLTDICKVLLNYGANVHLENSKKMTALHWAATEGHPDVVKLLLRYKAKYDIKDTDNNTPLYLAMCGKAQKDGRGDAYDCVIQLLSRKCCRQK